MPILNRAISKMRLLSLFDGTGSICIPFAAKGWECQRLDLDGKHGATVICDVLLWDYRDEPTPDVIFAGCPCEQYSICRTTAKTPRNFALADELVATTWRIIQHFLALNPKLKWFIENPASSLLWKRPVADSFPHRVILDFCTYGKPYRKRTKLATNTEFEGRPLCDSRTCSSCIDGKHIKSAQRGPCKGKDYKSDRCTLDELHGYPVELCEEICSYCM